MKVSRRNFFGVAAVAPVAAKQAVEKAVSVLAYEKTSGRVGGVIGNAASYGGIMPENPSCGWMQEEIKHLLQQRKKASERTYEHDVGELQSAMRIDGMRSVSPGVRARWIYEDRMSRAKAREVSYIDERINELKENLGPLGAIFE